MSHVEPMLLGRLSTERMRFQSSGAGLPRIEKMEKTAGYSPARTLLDVCVAPQKMRAWTKPPHCSRCWKCARAMVNLDVLGKLDDSGAVFDVPHYRKNKREYLLTIVKSAAECKPADRDLLELMYEMSLGPQIPHCGLVARGMTFLRKRLKPTLAKSLILKGD